MQTEEVRHDEIARGCDKIKRYNWTLKDEPGEVRLVHKGKLLINEDYQRKASQARVLALANAWSWVACGVLVVGEREGDLWVIDGQHRLLAARKRSDIVELPCIVFKTEGAKQEAIGFLNANTARGPVSAHSKYRAALQAGDETALTVQRIASRAGVEISQHTETPTQVKAIYWLMKRAAMNPDAVEQTLIVARKLCVDEATTIKQRLLEGLYIIHSKIGFDDDRLLSRIFAVGATRLLSGANKAVAVYGVREGGSAMYAQGMLNEINKGLRNKFSFDNQGE